ncbi:MAG: leucyl/phenylalanyl-tRNA--protein transferase [Thermoguttaceae bacterium]|nr:leucyl/phenylalanyl-tRNA--protein transferase [Thermoguttaceae bacterium]
MSSADAANDARLSFEIPPSRFFPPVEAAEPDGLLGIAFDGALHPDLIVDALVHGIFPWPFTVPADLGEVDFEEDADLDDEDDEDDDFEEFDAADDFDEDDDCEDFNNEDADDFAVFDETTDAADALFAALSPRCQNAVWEGFDASSLSRLGELRLSTPKIAESAAPNRLNPPNQQNSADLTPDKTERPLATREILGWWSPDPRAIFELDDFHVSRRLERTIRSGKFRVTFDEAFPETMLGCANAKGRANGESWITREFYASYCRLFELGLAHSAECWLGDRLVGGVYGVAINGFFDGESMFSVERDASKVALVALLRRLKTLGFQLFDLQIINDHTASLGGREIPRAEYLRRLNVALQTPTRFVP